MAFEIIMPKLGVDMQEGEIIEWKKQEGDVVNIRQTWNLKQKTQVFF
ncbi:biotin/lipoyl-containing protein [Streptococcus thermophilus]